MPRTHKTIQHPSFVKLVSHSQDRASLAIAQCLDSFAVRAEMHERRREAFAHEPSGRWRRRRLPVRTRHSAE